MNPNRNAVGWFEIYVQDMTRARAFYERVFEVTLLPIGTPELEMWSFPIQVDKPGSPGALVRYPGKDSGSGGTIIYFSCEDCAEEESRVSANGGSVQRPKMSIGQYGFISLVYDPDGNMIGLHSLK